MIQTIATIKEEPKKKQEGKDLQECWSITEVEEQKPSTIEVQKYSPLATKTKTKNFFKQESNQRYHLKLNIFGQLVPKNYFHRKKKQVGRILLTTRVVEIPPRLFKSVKPTLKKLPNYSKKLKELSKTRVSMCTKKYVRRIDDKISEALKKEAKHPDALSQKHSVLDSFF